MFGIACETSTIVLSLLLQLGELVQALRLKRRVAHREHLVYEQNIGLDVGGDGEPNRTIIPDE